MKDIDITFMLTVFTTSILIWMYLYNTIIKITTENPTDLSIIYLGVSHYLSFLCIICSFILLFNYGVKVGLDISLITTAKFISTTNFCSKFLFSFWAPMFILSLFSLVLHIIFKEFKLESKFMQAFPISILLVIIFFNQITGVSIFSVLVQFKIISYFIIIILFVPYLLILSSFAAKIDIVVEKEFYTGQETLRFKVIRSGYIFLPYLKQVLFNNLVLNECSVGTYSISLSKFEKWNSFRIDIIFKPQVLDKEKLKYHYISYSPI